MPMTPCENFRLNQFKDTVTHYFICLAKIIVKLKNREILIFKTTQTQNFLQCLSTCFKSKTPTQLLHIQKFRTPLHQCS